MWNHNASYYFLNGNCADLNLGLCRVSGAAFQPFNPSTLKKPVPEYMQGCFIDPICDRPAEVFNVSNALNRGKSNLLGTALNTLCKICILRVLL